MSILLDQTLKKIVYIQEFDKYDKNGKLLCRNINCNKYPQSPYRKYCSKKCNKEFRHWYYHNFFWERIRSDVFKRDNYTCQICKNKTTLEFFHNHNNLRTLCQDCHRQVTSKYLSSKFQVKKKQVSQMIFMK